ncbi:Ldh family oxidoreductase [Streptomyces sp. 8L]|uniref:Ldh family oxidoreductase n=1 Tax=Streptomyces sp. 8L TaxID=2877242 RepID=UPI001CD1C361|nr:Ldh family oxidoreductase [Streptomyces sp. 8L]MCA1220024.1 Ldh family oxidoreductase [Streptomyces sp. 8L]
MGLDVAIDDVRALMTTACTRAGVPGRGIDRVIEHYLDGELRGKPSHGLAKFAFESQFFSHRIGSPRVKHERGAMAVVDGRREVGPLSADFAVRLATRKARQLGVGVVGMVNCQRYGILASFSEQIAERGLVGLVANTSRPEATVHGARTPFLGVNPVSFAFPTSHGTVSADMSTTLAPMGVLWEARRTASPLPTDCFVDEDGAFTNDPDAARAAMVFGEHRGFALSLLIQVLTGSLFGFPMGEDVDSTWSTGYTFIALDPTFAGHGDAHRAANDGLVGSIRQAATREGRSVRLPGQEGKDRAARARKAGRLPLDEALYQRLQARAAGDFTSD